MNKISDIIASRRAIFPKMFQAGKEIEDDTILSLLKSANWAPTHKKTEPWRFVVFKEEGLQRLSDWMAADYQASSGTAFSEMKWKKTRNNPLQSSAVIAIILQRHKESGLPYWEEVAAVACAVQNLWLACADYGLGGYWSTPGSIARFGQFMPLEEGQECLGYFYLGYPLEELDIPGMRSPIDDKIKWEK